MRRRLALVSLAVTSLVVLAFLIPLATLVRNQAENRALSRAERDAQSIAAALAVGASGEEEGDVTVELANAVLDAFQSREGVTIIFPDDTFLGVPYERSPTIDRAKEGSAFTVRTEGGAEVLVPVLTADAPAAEATVVIRTFVSEDELQEGVLLAWAMLAGLGVFLVGVALIAADRLGRSIVRPVAELSDAARALGRGDLDTRVEPSGPQEIAETGEAFNFLADRLRALLTAERESVADLSHRLRTPLTALRLQAETLSDPLESKQLMADIDTMEMAVDRMIEEARRPSDERERPTSDLGAVVRHRATFWKVLADEQGRQATVHTSGGRLPVALGADELGAIVDTLIENVFSHTPPGVGYRISAQPGRDGSSVLTVEDDGPGFPSAEVVQRGESRGGSTGLGLDIALRAARRTGGDLQLVNPKDGGSRVVVEFGSLDAARADKRKGPAEAGP